MIKKITLLFCIVLMACALCACAKQNAVRIEQSALTDEAREQFEKLDGEQGIMLYGDPNKMLAKDVRMYAVLYGKVGQELTLTHLWKTLTMRVSGEAQQGYSVWRITYNPQWVERASFEVGGQGDYRMDGYEELAFVVEKELAQEAEAGEKDAGKTE